MVHKKTHSKKHSHSHKKKKHTKNIINKTVDATISVAKNSSKKYIPKVKTGIENVGSKVIKTGTKSIPFLQRMTRKFFGIFTGNKTKKHRKH